MPAAFELWLTFFASDGIISTAIIIDKSLHHLAVRLLLVCGRAEATAISHLGDKLRVRHQALHALVLILLLVMSVFSARGLSAPARTEVVIHQ